MSKPPRTGGPDAELGCPTSTERQKKSNKSLSFLEFCFSQALSTLDCTYSHWGGKLLYWGQQHKHRPFLEIATQLQPERMLKEISQISLFNSNAHKLIIPSWNGMSSVTKEWYNDLYYNIGETLKRCMKEITHERLHIESTCVYKHIHGRENRSVLPGAGRMEKLGMIISAYRFLLGDVRTFQN